MGFVRETLSKSIDFVREEIIPLRSDLIKAGLLKPDNTAYDPKASLVDPWAYANTAYGFKEKYSLIDYAKARQITYADPIVAAVIQTRLNQIAAFSVPQSDKYKVGFKIKMSDLEARPSVAAKKKIKEIQQFMLNCGVPENFDDTPEVKRRDNFETFIRKIGRDSLTFDQTNFEVTPRTNGIPYSFQAVDAATIRVIPDKMEASESVVGGDVNRFDYSNVMSTGAEKYFKHFKPAAPRYAQVINGVLRHVFDEWEMAFGVRNPRTDVLSFGYGFGEIEMLVATITSHMNAETYNRKFFCLTADTRIATDHGYRAIADVHTDGKTGSIWTGKKWTEYDVVKTGRKQVAVTTFKNGHKIRTSPDHQFRVYEGGLMLGWKKQSELCLGDFVLSDRKGFESRGHALKQKSYAGANHRAVEIEIAQIGPKLWEIFGWVMADGSIGEQQVSLHYRSRDEGGIRVSHEAVLRACGILFTEDNRERDPSKDFSSIHPRCGLRINSVGFVALCHELGFESAKYKGGHLPAVIFQETIENRKSFLRGVFSGNGYTGANSVTVTFVNDQILSDLQLLLSSVGFNSYKVGGRTLYVNEPVRFVEEIGFIQSYKNNGIEKERTTYGTHVDPKLARDICRAVYGPQDQRVGYSRDGEHRVLSDVAQRSKLTADALPRFRAVAYHGEGMSLAMLQRHLAEAGINAFDHLLERGFWAVEAAVQTEEFEEMYDVCCHDDVHEFVAEGVVVHNSQGSVIKGILTFEGSIPPDQLEAFRRQWYQQMSGVNNAWRTPIMGLGKDSKLNFVSLHSTNKEMEFGKWLEYCIKTICGVYQMDPIEIGFDISRMGAGQGGGGSSMGNFGNQAERITFSQDKGLRPLLVHIQSLLNDYIVHRIDPDFTFEFVGMNSGSEKDDLDKTIQQLKSFKTINEVRAEHDLPPLPKAASEMKSLGDVVLDPSWIQLLTGQQAAQQQGPGDPGGPGGPEAAPEGGEGPPEGEKQEPEPDYEKMSVEELQQELKKLGSAPGGDALQSVPGKQAAEPGAKPKQEAAEPEAKEPEEPEAKEEAPPGKKPTRPGGIAPGAPNLASPQAATFKAFREIEL